MKLVKMSSSIYFVFCKQKQAKLSLIPVILMITFGPSHQADPPGFFGCVSDTSSLTNYETEYRLNDRACLEVCRKNGKAFSTRNGPDCFCGNSIGVAAANSVICGGDPLVSEKVLGPFPFKP